MRKLEFTRLILRNFKDYRGKHVLDLVGLGFGLHFVAGDNRVDRLGSNGAGKSSLWDAFFWAATGRTVRGLRGTDVRGWHVSKPASVRFDFWLDDQEHWVKRSTKKNGLWLDGKITTQDAIDKLLGLSAVTIPHTLIIGQKRELFFDLEPAKKMAVLSEALDLDKWAARSDKAKDKTLKLKIDRNELIRAAEYTGKEEAALLSQIQATKALLASWENERSRGAEKREREIAALRKALEDAKTEQAEYDLAYDGAETELRAARKTLKTQTAELNAATKAAAKEDEVLQGMIRRLEELRAIKTTCPTCGQRITDKVKQKEHAKAEINALAKKISAQMVRAKNANTKEDNAQVRLNRINKSITVFGEKSDQAKDYFDHVATRMHHIELDLTKLKAQVRDDEVCPYDEPLAHMRSRYKKMRKERVKMNDIMGVIDRRITRTSYWIDGFKQIRLQLVQDALAHMQNVTNSLLPQFGLEGWLVEYATERETKAGKISQGLTVTILKPGMKKGVKWESWSGGEGQRLLIAGALAFSQVILERSGIECDFLVLDEPTRHMSREGVSDTVDALLEWSRDKQTFYTDHQAIESNRFTSVVTITKDEHGSRIDVQR